MDQALPKTTAYILYHSPFDFRIRIFGSYSEISNKLIY